MNNYNAQVLTGFDLLRDALYPYFRRTLYNRHQDQRLARSGILLYRMAAYHQQDMIRMSPRH